MSNYFAGNDLHVIHEDWVQGSGGASLPKSFNAVKLWLAASKEKEKGVAVTAGAVKNVDTTNRLREIQFFGAYQNVYQAMTGFANKRFNVIPVSIDMVLPDDGSKESEQGELKWVLRLWI